MTRRNTAYAFALICPLSLGAIFGQDAKPRPSPAGQIRLAAPEEEHRKLAGYAGDWLVEVKMGNGGRALVYQGASKTRMTVGGRFLEIEYAANGDSEVLEGMFVIAFDARHRRFALVALDSFGTYFVTSQGKRDDQSGKAKLLGSDDDPQMKAMGYTKEFSHVLDFRSAEEFAIEVWFVDTRTAERREFKYMDYVFKRKQ